MQLSRQPSEPLYLELAQVLRGELRHYRIGDFLPGEMQLARRFAVNRHTLRRAVDELVQEGRLLRRQGKGTQVLQRPLVYPLQADSAYSDALAALGVRTEARLLARRQRRGSAPPATGRGRCADRAEHPAPARRRAGQPDPPPLLRQPRRTARRLPGRLAAPLPRRTRPAADAPFQPDRRTPGRSRRGRTAADAPAHAAAVGVHPVLRCRRATGGDRPLGQPFRPFPVPAT